MLVRGQLSTDDQVTCAFVLSENWVPRCCLVGAAAAPAMSALCVKPRRQSRNVTVRGQLKEASALYTILEAIAELLNRSTRRRVANKQETTRLRGEVRASPGLRHSLEPTCWPWPARSTAAARRRLVLARCARWTEGAGVTCA